jgi:hypothetical protein
MPPWRKTRTPKFSNVVRDWHAPFELGPLSRHEAMVHGAWTTRDLVVV